MILFEPLDERQIQELHSMYHEAEETILDLREALRELRRGRKAILRRNRDLEQELSRYKDQYEQCSADRVALEQELEERDG